MEKILFAIQSAVMIILFYTKSIAIWNNVVFCFFLNIMIAMDGPLRQSLFVDLVKSKKDLKAKFDFKKFEDILNYHFSYDHTFKFDQNDEEDKFKQIFKRLTDKFKFPLNVTEEDFISIKKIDNSDIEKMEVSREYTKVIMRGDVPHYEEYLNIWCKGEAYEFHKAMNIDMDTVAEHPEQLESEFKKGTFFQLQNYINSNLSDSL